MPVKIHVDPVTRVEGHLSITLETEGNKIVEARCSGEMFRGFEVLLKGRDPLDAQQIVQRICGVCPISHGICATYALEKTFNISSPKNGRLLKNIIQGANTIQSNILHFYHLSLLDYLNINDVIQYKGNDALLCSLKSLLKENFSSQKGIISLGPFYPRYKGSYSQDVPFNIEGMKHYLEAFKIRRYAHKLGAVFGGRLPHSPVLFPGGVSDEVTVDKIMRCKSLLSKIRKFINECYLPDAMELAKKFPSYFSIGKGCGNFLTCGAYPLENGEKLIPAGVRIEHKQGDFDETLVTEYVKYSKYSSSHTHPSRAETIPYPEKEKAYSWIKAPRYNNKVVEVGPLAVVIVSYFHDKNSRLSKIVKDVMQKMNINISMFISVMGRHLSRAIVCKFIADSMEEWLDQLEPGKPTMNIFSIPEMGIGAGFTEAPRGALGHWIEIQNHKIHRYQCVVPTTWNCSPRDDNGNPGPVEQALIGAPLEDKDNPIEAVRIVRSFDPCLACAVH